MSYRALLSGQTRFLAAGFALCFFSSFGQTFFLGVFGGVIRGEFGLSHSGYGLLYSAATLSSACALVWLGRGLDRYDLRHYTLAVCLGLAVACAWMAWSPGLVGLFVAVLALRLCGQGLMGHIAMTSMARYFDRNRAKAISLAGLGFAAGEAVWPRGAIALLQQVGWRELWLGIAVLAAVVIAPLLLWLLKGHDLRHRAHLEALGLGGETHTEGSPAQGQWTRAEVLRDPRFYLWLPTAVAAPMLVTGMFFHQVRIAELQGWSMEWYGSCFVIYAAAQVTTGLLAGPLVDRYGADRLFPIQTLPMGLGMVVLGAWGHPLACPLYLGLAGATAGAVSTVSAAMWAESYGVVHLGAIRATVTAIMVFSTALSPVAMGGMLDAGSSVAGICALWVGYLVLALVLAVAARGGIRSGDQEELGG